MAFFQEFFGVGATIVMLIFLLFSNAISGVQRSLNGGGGQTASNCVQINNTKQVVTHYLL